MADDTKGAGRPGHPFEVKDAAVPFQVREADEREARETFEARVAEINRQIEGLRRQGERADS